MSDGGQIIEIPRSLVRIVAVQQQPQGVRVPLQILAIDQTFELRLLARDAGFELFGLLGQVAQRLLQPRLLERQRLQLAFRRGDVGVDGFQFGLGRRALIFGLLRVLAQFFDLPAELLEIALFFDDIASRRAFRGRCLSWAGGQCLSRQGCGQERNQRESAGAMEYA